jgi:hypothetical protein
MPMSRVAWFKEQLAKYDRIAVTGCPRSGKSTLCKLAEQYPKRTVIHTDSYKGLDWSEASAMVAKIVNETPGKVVIEGVAVPRALRKGMDVDAVISLSRMDKGSVVGALEPLSSGRLSMGKSVHTVLDEWKQSNPDVPVLYAPPAAPNWSETFYEEEKDEE